MLGRLPDRAFARVVGYYRRQIDVLVSSLPVGAKAVTMADVPTVIACHTPELTLPYYFLLVGTRATLDVSYSSRFPQAARFMEMPAEDSEWPDIGCTQGYTKRMRRWRRAA